jgi:glycosyltransferase involved in cell wall biosynthesis
MLAFRAGHDFGPQTLPSPALPPTPKERLAIVSTSSRLCGIAAYTAALQRQLDEAFDVTVFDLDQYLLRSRHRRVRKLADRHIHEICHAIAAFDAVNLQLEHGTLGWLGTDIYRRFRWLAAAAPRLSVTFHSLPLPPALAGAAVAKALLTAKWLTAGRLWAGYRRRRLLSLGIAHQLRRLQRSKPVGAIVHNRRDLYDAKFLYGIEQVFDHPLSFLSPADAAAIRADASRGAFAMLDALPSDAVLIGVFGFLNEYKGIRTAVEALHHLPQNRHLLIFGGIHPNEIAAHQPIHPYISSLFTEAYVGTTLYDQIGTAPQPGAPQLVLTADRGIVELLGRHPRDLSARIHFMGALGDAAFLTGMAICDAVVFPYLEVGQSSSGPISQAIELGCRVIASRTHNFLGFAEYHKQAIEFFDIGNHIELAERILARPQFAAPRPFPEFNVDTNMATYLLANSGWRRLRNGNGPVRGVMAEAAAADVPR